MKKADARPPGQTVSVWLSEEATIKYDELAKKAGMSRSKLLANVLETVIDDLYLCNKVGLWSFAIIMRDLKTSMRTWLNYCVDEPHHVGEESSDAISPSYEVRVART